MKGNNSFHKKLKIQKRKFSPFPARPHHTQPKRERKEETSIDNTEYQRVWGEILSFKRHVQNWKKDSESMSNAKDAA